jgi:hypothetical protein
MEGTLTDLRDHLYPVRVTDTRVGTVLHARVQEMEMGDR